MRAFFEPLGKSLPLSLFPPTCLLDYCLSRLDRLDLAAYFIFDSPLDRAERIEVLDLDLGTKLPRFLRNGNVRLDSHLTFFHVRVARTEIAQKELRLAR